MAGIPQVITEDRASGAQFIDGSLKFDSSKRQYLRRTPTADGNRRLWTWSGWLKQTPGGSEQDMFSAGQQVTNDGRYSRFRLSSDSLNLRQWVEPGPTLDASLVSSMKLRDPSAFFHCVMIYDVDNSTTADKVRWYINGQRVTSFSSTDYPGDSSWINHSSKTHTIGGHYDGGGTNADSFWNGHMSQVYFIDGQALGPENFGFTDPLTNTWRPKKYTGTFTKSSPNNGTNWTSSLSATSGTLSNGANAFDGNLSTRAQTANAAPGKELTFAPPAINFTTSLEVYCDQGSNVPTATWNGNTVNPGGGAWVTVYSGSGELSSTYPLVINTEGAAQFATLKGVRIDGEILIDNLSDTGANSFYLPMDGNSPIGEDKSGIISPNDGSIWSNSLTSSSGFRSGEPKTNAFDGNTSSICSAVGSGTVTFTSPVTFASNSTIRVFLHGGDHTVTVNGGSNQTISAGSFQTVTYSNSGNATFTMTFHRGGGADTGVRAIEINGVILIDSVKGNSWTPINFGGSASLEKATGAIPILNTNGGGTVAKSDVRTDKKTYTVTASGGKYYLDGVETPTLNFLRGGTYIFDYTGATSHPFKFSTTSDGTHGGGSEYTDGTNTATSNVMKITVPHNAPDTLYYYCSAHSGMGSSINVTTDVLKADPYAWKCVLALPLLGSKDDVSASINVNSTTKTTAITGNAASSFDSSDLYGRSFIFDGNSDYVEITPTSGSTLADNTAPYTIEFFFSIDSARMSDNTYNIMWSTSSGLTIAKWRSGISNKVYFESDGNATGWNLQTQENISANTWYHFAAVRDGNTIKTFIDGVLQGTATATYTASAETWWRVGGQNANSTTHDGYIQDFRVYDGVAKYAEDFTRVSTSPDILPDTPSGISGKTNLTKITDGAVSFDGSGDYLDAPTSNSDLGIAGGDDFTIECFTYAKEYVMPNGSYMEMIRQGTNNAGSDGVYFNLVNDNTLQFRISGTTKTTTGKLNAGGWNHVSVCRSSGTLYMSINGIVENFGSVTNSSTTGDFRIGANFEGTHFYGGQISNVRFIKGTALYTSNFTPPTEPLTNVTNTKLLCCQSTTSAGAATVSPSLGGINDGTVWSDTTPSTLSYADGPRAIFDGSLSTRGGHPSGTNLNTYVTLTDGCSISASTGIRIYWNGVGSGQRYIRINGTTELDDGSAQLTPGWSSVSSFSGTINKIEVKTAATSSWSLSAVEVDGTILTDPVQQNGDAAATNFNPFTDDINTIRGQETGYATWNPLSTRGVVTTSGGNLVADTVQNGNGWALSTIPMTSGKYYCEMNFEGEMYHTTNFNYIGIVPTDITEAYTGLDIFRGLGALAIESNASKVRASIGTGGGATQSDWNTSIGYDERSTIGIAIDCDTPLVKFYVDGKDVGTFPYTMAANKSWVVFCNDWASGYQDFEKYILNAGQKPFKFPPPDGFQPMNLSTVQPEKVFARPEQYVSATLFTGTGDAVSSRTVELPHAADLVWAKSRDRASSHQIADTVRGNNSVLQSNANQTARNPTTQYSGGGVSTIDGKTITIASGTSNNANLNTDNNKGVIWSWKAGGSSNTFNIDDVGYANASDVNMNVGGQNSSAYDQSQSFSAVTKAGSTTYSPTDSDTGFLNAYPTSNAFNGTETSNVCYTNNNNVWLYVQLSTAITVSSTIEFGARNTVQIRINGISYSYTGGGTDGTQNSRSIRFSGSLTEFAIRDNDNSGYSTGLSFLKVDGKLLVDSGATPPNVPSVANTGCSVGTKQGFSIVAYNATGSDLTVSHGLSERPGLIILKTVHSTSGDWLVWHQSLDGVDRFLKLNDNTVPQSQASNVFLSVDSNTFGTGNDAGINSDGQQKIAYLWHDVPGLQKFGLWNGNGSANGPFIETGFRPAIILYKDITSTGYWNIKDSSRTTYNGATHELYPATSEIENHHNSDRPIDFLSNGFKIRSGNSAINDASRRYVYAAWAEAPSINLYGGHANAR